MKSRRYVDIDVHHGDGVEEAFVNTDRVMTVCVYLFCYALTHGIHYTGDVDARLAVTLPPFVWQVN